MKDCEHCKYLINQGGYEYPEYACELLGCDDGYDKFAKGDGCCLHHMEVKHALDLLSRIDFYYGYDERLTNEEKSKIIKRNAIYSKNYNDYMKHLEEKYARK